MQSSQTADEALEIHEPRDSTRPGLAEYFVFSEMLKEPWAKHFDKPWFVAHNFQFPREILSDKGYQEVNSPQNNDVVGYASERGEFQHWGIFQNGKVLSRFGSGNVYKHDINGTRYGDRATFFRKTQKRE